MNRNLSIYKISSLVVLTVSLLISGIRTGILGKNIDIESVSKKNAYFIERNSETVGFVIFSVCFAVAFIALAIIIGKKAVKFIESEQSPVVFASALCGFMLMATGLYYSYLYFTTNAIATGKFIISVTMIAASVMFLYLALSKNDQYKTIIPVMRLIPIIYAFVRLLVDFVEQNSLPQNSAIAFHILSLAFLALFLVYDGKTVFGTIGMRAYLAIGYLCVFTLLVYSIPNLILTITKYPGLDRFILFSAVDIVLAFYVFARTYSVTGVSKTASESSPDFEDGAGQGNGGNSSSQSCFFS